MRHNAPHVLATTGLPHALIMALTPGDIDWDGRRVLAHPRRKGTGTAKVWLPVSAVAIKAWRVFVAAEAWGPYETSAFARPVRFSRGLWTHRRRSLSLLLTGLVAAVASVRVRRAGD